MKTLKDKVIMAPNEKDTTSNSTQKPVEKSAKKDNQSMNLIQTMALNFLAEKFKIANREEFLKVLKEEGTQAVTNIVADIMVNPKFKNLKEIKKEDVLELFKRHGLQKAFQYGQNIIKDAFTDKPKETVTPAASSSVAPAGTSASTTATVLTDKTNFSEFVGYVLTNPAFKDAHSDGKVVSFIASQSAQEDIVVGNAPKWDKVIQQSRLLASSGLDQKSNQRMTAQLVESLFDKDMSQKFKEHFGLAKAPAVKTAPARKKAKP